MNANTVKIVKQIKTATVSFASWWPDTSRSILDKKGFGNGYVGVPKGHPWFEVAYDNIVCDVHGGLTYGCNEHPVLGMRSAGKDGLWWIGFDTAHLGDTPETCPESYVNEEVEKLKQQAIDAAIEQK